MKFELEFTDKKYGFSPEKALFGKGTRIY